MAGTDDLKNMLMAFRISELQTLLGFAGRSKNGRKNELQSRALDLLSLKSAPIQMKIRELYKAIGLQHGERSAQQYQPNPPPGAIYHPAQQQVKAPVYPGYFTSQPASPPPATMANSLPVHPDVRLKRLPFYDYLSELLKPSTLMPVGTGRIQEHSFVFYFTPAQANEIAFNRNFDSGSSEYIVQAEDPREFSPLTNEAVVESRKRKRSGPLSEGDAEVQMRFCLLETSCEQEDCFPPGIIVKVNGKACPLPPPIPTNKQGEEPKRLPRPVDISSLVRISPTIANTILVSWAAEFGRGYVIAISLVKKLTSRQLLNRLKSRGVRHADYTTALIKEKLCEDPDSEIATTSLRVSLLCPLGKVRMGLPCRPTTCSHLQCFDASLYLQMNERKPTWVCPVCDQPGLYDQLVIDGYFQEVLSSSRLPGDAHEVELHQDGSWSISHGATGGGAADTDDPAPVRKRGGPPVVAATVEIIDDEIVPVDSSDSDEKNQEDVKGKIVPPGHVFNASTVDLTLSDDDTVLTPVAATVGPAIVAASSTIRAPLFGDNSSADIISLDSPSPPSTPEPPSTCETEINSTI